MSSFGGSFGKFGGGGAALQRQPADGSYDASDFGGGFQGTQDTGVGGSSPRSPKRSGAIVQTLTPVTVRQLQLAQHSHPDDIFKVDDRELNQITLVGQIVNLQVQSTNVELEVDDGTGKIGVRMWLDVGEETGTSGHKWNVGSYVRVIGNLRSFLDTRSVLAFRVLPIKQFDELTYHFLDAIHVHLAVTRGDLESDKPSLPASHDQNRGPIASGRRAAPLERKAVTGQFTYTQQAVLEVIRVAGRRNQDGCSIGEVFEALGAQFTETDLREAIEWLQGEGHLYNTVSEEFFRCAE